MHAYLTASTSWTPAPDHWPAHFLAAKKAYALACIEQLVPVLGEITIRHDVFHSHPDVLCCLALKLRDELNTSRYVLQT